MNIKKVYVGMSGGVDSSVSSYLLQKEGYEVTGVFIKTWSPDWMPCTWREERLDALRVAVHLGIPLITIDGEKEYKEKVADYMISEYKAGRTPNPDFFCNNFIKFGLFYDYAIANGADYVATGHYARIVESTKLPCLPAGRKVESEHVLCTAKDSGKDQSYFVAGIKKGQLSKILFPIGDLLKSKVREIARKAKLPVAEKKDSQGLCFLGPVNIEDFLSHYIPTKQGDVLDESGKVIGEHNGAEFITLGQRHGFKITDSGLAGRTFYINSKNLSDNTITVSEQQTGVRRNLTLSQTNWFIEPEEGREYACQCRYHQKALRCKVSGNNVELLDTPADPPTPGQICVIYDGKKIIGSGVIS
ncbi:MAG: tRNA 2-thiouridine(34) synthase MnmA [Candidatus Paceibacterota bacterium]|jgi:tRNA-specific 2-thiouridylase